MGPFATQLEGSDSTHYKGIFQTNWGPSATQLEEIDTTYYKGYTTDKLGTFCHTIGRNSFYRLQRLYYRQLGDLWPPNWKEMILLTTKVILQTNWGPFATQLEGSDSTCYKGIFQTNLGPSATQLEGSDTTY